MDIFELYDTLPNGLHDAQLSKLTIDYVGRTLDMELEVWVGSMEDPPGPDREKLLPATLHLDGLAYCVIDPPDPRYPYAEARTISIDVHAIDPEKAPSLPTDLPDGTFSFQMWALAWNSFLHAAATDASLTWRGESP